MSIEEDAIRYVYLTQDQYDSLHKDESEKVNKDENKEETINERLHD